MGEAEYYEVLDAVGVAMGAAPAGRLDHSVDWDDDFIVVPVAANDNDGSWPHLPFPEGWTASC